MRVSPSTQSAPPSPQGPAPQQAQGGAPGQGQSPAIQAIQMIMQGYKVLGQMIQQAGQGLPPQDVKLFQTALQSTEAFIQALTSPAQQQQQQPPQRPSGPMPMNAGPGNQGQPSSNY